MWRFGGGAVCGFDEKLWFSDLRLIEGALFL
jgi:hypothetical protein